MSYPETITLTGRVFVEFEEDEPHIGDVIVKGELDKAGRFARRYGHTNFGYSGNVKAKVWRGKGWSRLWLYGHINPEQMKYQTQYAKSEPLEAMAECVRKMKGTVVCFEVPPKGKQRQYVPVAADRVESASQ